MPDDRAVLPSACQAIAAAACRVWWWLYRISCFTLFSLSLFPVVVSRLLPFQPGKCDITAAAI